MDNRRGYNPVIAESNMAKLPEQCAATNPATGSSVLIKRGEAGYYSYPGLDVNGFNQRAGVTAPQVEAMICGSMFGWDVPGANPDRCDGRTAEKFV
jgi:hypothetical protein